MATSTAAILRDALARIKPVTDELKEAQRFVDDLNKRLKAKRIKAVAMIGGSGAKGTHLAGDHDIDVFVRFDLATYRMKGDALSDLLATALPKGAERIHGSRDYFQLTHGAHFFEIIPVLHVTKPEQAQNVMDVSPLHVAYVTTRLKKKKGLADEIRLAKQFCKAAKVYGAESFINGFSGHVVDLLVLEYGSFLGLLRAAASWKGRVILDPAKHHRNPQFSLNSSKRQGPMILVDPIQPERNAAAALSQQAFDKFRTVSAAFLKRPSALFFEIVPLTPALAQQVYAVTAPSYKLKTLLFTDEGIPDGGKDDVVATRLLKRHESLVEALTLHGFTILDSSWEYDRKRRRSASFIVVKDELLPKTLERAGPPLSMKTACASFKKEHPGAKAKGGRLVATIARQYRSPKQVVAAFATLGLSFSLNKHQS